MVDTCVAVSGPTVALQTGSGMGSLWVECKIFIAIFQQSGHKSYVDAKVCSSLFANKVARCRTLNGEEIVRVTTPSAKQTKPRVLK